MINLIPPTIKQERIYGRRNVALFGYSMALLATAVLTASILFGSLLFIGSVKPDIEAEIKETNVSVSALESEIKGVEAIASRLDTAKAISDTSISFSELIPKIGAVLPNGVIMNALTLTGGKVDPLQLDVDMESADLAAVLVRNLVESKLFEAADITSLSPKGAAEDDQVTSSRYTFTASIGASFTGTAEAKRKAAAAAAAAAAASAQEAQKTETAE